MESLFNATQRFESDIYIGDYTHYVEENPLTHKKGVVMSNLPLNDIASLHFINHQHISVLGVNFEKNLGYFKDKGGLLASNCECMLVSGLYMPMPNVIKSVREEIMLEGARFDKAIKSCKGFTLDWQSALKKIPQGYNAEDEFSQYYRLKDYIVTQELTKEQVVSPDFLNFVLKEFEKTYTFNVILNDCVSYAKENF